MINDIERVRDAGAAALIETSYTMPGQDALTAPDHPDRQAAATILRGGVDRIGKAQRSRIELVNDRVLDMVLHHGSVQAPLQSFAG